jgi:hypothetical protein
MIAVTMIEVIVRPVSALLEVHAARLYEST